MAFTKGKSGNEAGRPKGTTVSTQIRHDIEKALPGILKTVIEQASGGDIQAAKILLDKVCPNLRPQALPISLPVNGSLTEQGNEIIRAALSGQIPPDIGSQLITALANQSKIIEIDELSKRVEALENQK